MSSRKTVIDRVEPTADMLGWVVFFDDNKHQQRILAKYAIEPRVGDSLELYGFPHTYGAKINGRTVFMFDRKDMTIHYNDLFLNQKRVQSLEKLLVKSRKNVCLN